eukprot:TRINITY_DN3146_c0_g1_i2.p1 TRINITY_DN3146_c0_g1~~TRINITY_DN3146_c0_g1_i2.p1  ORF type:complete len:388 (+),score=98.80 TRINITY_DN3146_c0_g1_i2:216-1379(+)
MLETKPAAFERYQVESFELAMASLAEEAPESAADRLEELKVRVVLGLQAAGENKAANKAVRAFFDEPPTTLKCILADKRGATGSTQFNQAYVSRRLTPRSVQAFAQELLELVTVWMESLKPCLLDELAVATHQQEYSDLGAAQPEPSPIPAAAAVVSIPSASPLPPALDVPGRRMARRSPPPAVFPPKPKQIHKRAATHKRAAVAAVEEEEPVVREDEPLLAPEAIKLRAQSERLLQRGGEDPLDSILRSRRRSEEVRRSPRNMSKKQSRIQLRKCEKQPVFDSDDDEDTEDENGTFPTLGDVPPRPQFRPLSEIGNQTRPESEMEKEERPQRARKRVRWSPAEVAQLRKGVDDFGEGQWADILEAFQFNEIRTGVDLKDKWRNIKK